MSHSRRKSLLPSRHHCPLWDMQWRLKRTLYGFCLGGMYIMIGGERQREEEEGERETGRWRGKLWPQRHMHVPVSAARGWGFSYTWYTSGKLYASPSPGKSCVQLAERGGGGGRGSWYQWNTTWRDKLGVIREPLSYGFKGNPISGSTVASKTSTSLRLFLFSLLHKIVCFYFWFKDIFLPVPE